MSASLVVRIQISTFHEVVFFQGHINNYLSAIDAVKVKYVSWKKIMKYDFAFANQIKSMCKLNVHIKEEEKLTKCKSKKKAESYTRSMWMPKLGEFSCARRKRIFPF